MNIAYTNSQDFSFFSDAKVQLEQIINELKSKNYRDKEHGDIEKYIDREGQEIFRCLLQGWFDIKNTNEVQYEYIHSSNDQYSDGTRYRLSKEVIRGSFDNAIETMNETTGAHIARRQNLNIIQDVAQDNT